jgi:hypothetical protein
MSPGGGTGGSSIATGLDIFKLRLTCAHPILHLARDHPTPVLTGQ